MDSISNSITKGDPKNKLVIVGVPSIRGTTSSASPYVAKVETFCRLAGIPYDVELLRDIKDSPKKMVPYIKHGDVLLADSEFIVDYLTNTYDIKVKACEDPKMQGPVVAAKTVCEHHLSHGITCFRWMKPQAFKVVKATVFRKIPLLLRWIVLPALHRYIHSALIKQGFARHSWGDLEILLDRSLRSLSQILGEQKYFGGSEPCPEDASMFAVLDNYLKPEIEGVKSVDLIKKYPNLVAYVENMKTIYFPKENPSRFFEDH